MGDLLKEIGLDRYDINARLRPALLAVLPGVLLVVVWYPGVWSFLSGTIALISACGMTYLIAQIARRRGRLVEKRLGDRAGRAHSAKLLTHSDLTFARDTKDRYHTYIRSHGIQVSTVEEEQRDPTAALARARSAVDWLLEHTRSSAKETLLLDENIAYGFHRNLYGLKPVALVIVVLASIANGLLLGLRHVDENTFYTGVLLQGLLAASFLGWLTIVNQNFVSDASLAYAQKLFSQCEAADQLAQRNQA